MSLKSFGVPELQPGDLFAGEEVLAQFHASLQGRYSIFRIGVAFVTDRRLLWLQERYVMNLGARLSFSYSEIARCALKEERSSAWHRSYVNVRLPRYREYDFHAGSRLHVTLTDNFMAFPVHGLLRQGDKTKEFFEALQQAARAFATSHEIAGPEFLVWT